MLEIAFVCVPILNLELDLARCIIQAYISYRNVQKSKTKTLQSQFKCAQMHKNFKCLLTISVELSLQFNPNPWMKIYIT